MYIQLTDRCNMHCDHCCMDSSRSRKGFMDEATFSLALSMAIDHDGCVTIGGGEPTLHPKFFDFLNDARRAFRNGDLSCSPFVVTNGKNKRRALRLLKETQPDDDCGMYVDSRFPNGEPKTWHDEPGVYVELSIDYFHEPIDPMIMRLYVDAQRRKDNNRYGRILEAAGTRDTSGHIMPIGRALKNGIVAKDKTACACETMFIAPDGKVFSCGCKHTQIGDLRYDTSFTDWYSEEYAHFGGHDHEQETIDLAEEAEEEMA